MSAFSREAQCPDCGREYLVSGSTAATGSETEVLAQLRCSCGEWMWAFVPGSAPQEQLIVTLTRDNWLAQELPVGAEAEDAKKTA
jgi:hypothetical protein